MLTITFTAFLCYNTVLYISNLQYYISQEVSVYYCCILVLTYKQMIQYLQLCCMLYSTCALTVWNIAFRKQHAECALKLAFHFIAKVMSLLHHYFSQVYKTILLASLFFSGWLLWKVPENCVFWHKIMTYLHYVWGKANMSWVFKPSSSMYPVPVHLWKSCLCKNKWFIIVHARNC